MAPNLVLNRSRTPSLKISRIIWSESTSEWSSVNLSPHALPEELIYRVSCCSNGLLCFRYCHDLEDSDYVIWNPSTDTVHWIPSPDSRYAPCTCASKWCQRSFYPAGRGLGFVPGSLDFKFVRFMNHFNEVVDDDEGIHITSELVAVYSSKNNSWRELSFPLNFHDFSPLASISNGCNADEKIDGVCVNGFCYWKTGVDVILSFDLSTDNFSTLPYPDDMSNNIAAGRIDFRAQWEVVFLIELDGSLGLVILSNQSELNFWVYKGRGIGSPSPSPISQWTRKINLDVRLYGALRPLWLGKKKKINLVLLLQGVDGALLEYDYTTRELKKIDYDNDDDDGDDTRILKISFYPYVDNSGSNHINTNAKDEDEDEDEEEDRISQLPDDILLTILSSLSLKEAASTTVLSTRWSDLWRYTPNLNFQCTYFNKCISKEWVNSVLESHKALYLKQFNISFPLYQPAARRTLSKWLGFAFSRRVEALELNLFGRKFVFLEKFMQKRSIYLTSLCLTCLKVSGEDIELALRNCPSLLRLILKFVFLTSDFEICGGALKHLDMKGSYGYGYSVKGYTPNLTFLRISYCSQLVQGYYKQQSARKPLFLSSQLTTLEFTLPLLSLIEALWEKGLPQMPTLRELILAYDGDCILPITWLLCAMPFLEEFEVKNYTPSGRFRRHVKVVNNIENFDHCHLRVFKFTWFYVGKGDHMELVSYILDNCVALEKIILNIFVADSASHVAASEYVKQLQFKLPTHIQLIIN